MPDPTDALAALILLVAAGVQGFLGFGFGIVAMTCLTLSHDLLHAAGVVNLTGMLVTSSVLWTLRRSALWDRVLRLLPGLLIGVVVGVTALRSLDRTWMVRALGVTVVGISAWNLAAPALRPPAGRWVEWVVGLLSGMLGGAFNTGGPPLVAHLYARPGPPEAAKATVQALFLVISLSRLPVATAQGLIRGSMCWDALLATPFVVCGLAVGLSLGRRVGADRFRRLAWLALGALGFLLIGTA